MMIKQAFVMHKVPYYHGEENEDYSGRHLQPEGQLLKPQRHKARVLVPVLQYHWYKSLVS